MRQDGFNRALVLCSRATSSGVPSTPRTTTSCPMAASSWFSARPRAPSRCCTLSSTGSGRYPRHHHADVGWGPSLTSARYIRVDSGPSASFTVVTSASTATTRGSNVTIASPALRSTCTRVTPGTLSSADRTATTHPSQTMPATANVTVAGRGDVLHPIVQSATVINNCRLVMGVSSCPQSHHKTRGSRARSISITDRPTSGQPHEKTPRSVRDRTAHGLTYRAGLFRGQTRGLTPALTPGQTPGRFER
jgi:hypothetical protein